jgi:hypothetical protein
MLDTVSHSSGSVRFLAAALTCLTSISESCAPIVHGRSDQPRTKMATIAAAGVERAAAPRGSFQDDQLGSAKSL